MIITSRMDPLSALQDSKVSFLCSRAVVWAIPVAMLLRVVEAGNSLVQRQVITPGYFKIAIENGNL